MEPIHPVDEFLAWFSSVDPLDRDDVAWATIPLLQGRDLGEPALENLFDTASQLEGYLKTLRESETLNLAFRLGALAGAIDVYFGNRTTAADWDSIRDDLMSAEGGVPAGAFEKSLAQRLDERGASMADRKSRGMKIAKSWADLRAVELSARYLAYWGKTWGH
jgi:hypothetical protein